eukprot:531193_1
MANVINYALKDDSVERILIGPHVLKGAPTVHLIDQHHLAHSINVIDLKTGVLVFKFTDVDGKYRQMKFEPVYGDEPGRDVIMIGTKSYSFTNAHEGNEWQCSELESGDTVPTISWLSTDAVRLAIAGRIGSHVAIKIGEYFLQKPKHDHDETKTITKTDTKAEIKPKPPKKTIHPSHVLESITNVIKKANVFADDAAHKYSTYIKAADFNSHKLNNGPYDRFPIKVTYIDPLEHQARAIYLVIVIEKTLFEYPDIIGIIVPLAWTTKTAAQSFDLIKKMDEEKPTKDPREYAIFTITYDNINYIGEGKWLSTDSKVGITPGWGHGTGATNRALRMVNFVWKTLGVDRAYINDDARFPCGNFAMKKIAPFAPANEAKEFGRARILRLFQGKSDSSIYLKGGYDFVEYDMIHEDLNVKKLRRFRAKLKSWEPKILSYTVREFLEKEMGEEPEPTKSTKENRALWYKIRNLILSQVPREQKTDSVKCKYKKICGIYKDSLQQLKPDSDVLLKDMLLKVFANSCEDYYKIMHYIHNVASDFIGRGSILFLWLDKWFESTSYLLMTNIQDKIIDAAFYSGIYESYGHATSCSWGIAFCKQLGGVSIAGSSGSADNRYRCKLDKDDQECGAKHHKVDGMCWGNICAKVGAIDNYPANTQDLTLTTARTEYYNQLYLDTHKTSNAKVGYDNSLYGMDYHLGYSGNHVSHDGAYYELDANEDKVESVSFGSGYNNNVYDHGYYNHRNVNTNFSSMHMNIILMVLIGLLFCLFFTFTALLHVISCGCCYVFGRYQRNIIGDKHKYDFENINNV